MYCDHCGYPCKEGAKFCSHCGALLPVEDEPETDGFDQTRTWDGKYYTTLVDGDGRKNGGGRISKKLLGIIIGILAAAVVVAVVILLLLRGVFATEVDLDDYLSASYEGYDGFGSVEAVFDEEAFLNDYGDAVKGDAGDYDSSAEAFLATCVAYEATFEDDAPGNGCLANGDTVDLHWECDDDTAKKTYKLKLTYSDKTEQVVGLDKTTAVDVFEYVEVAFAGISSKAVPEVSVTSEDSPVSASDFAFSEDAGLKNGDTVTLTLTDDAEARLGSEGMVAEPASQDYIVDGLATYITNVADVPHDIYHDIGVTCGDILRSNGTQTADGNVYLANVSYTGMLLQYKANDDASSAASELYVTYRVSLMKPAENEGDDPTELAQFYSYVLYANPYLDADGSLVMPLDEGTPCGDAAYSYGNGVYYGYGSMGELVNAVRNTDLALAGDCTIDGINDMLGEE